MHSAALGILTVGAYERKDPRREAGTNAHSPNIEGAERRRDTRLTRLSNSRATMANRKKVADGLWALRTSQAQDDLRLLMWLPLVPCTRW